MPHPSRIKRPCRTRQLSREIVSWLSSSRASLVVVALVVLIATSHARETIHRDPDYVVDVWDTQDGLPQNSVTSIVQARDGYLWMGTFGGLVRFDGVRFVVFDTQNTPELPNNSIVRLFLDSQDNLWISTTGGLVRRSAGKFVGYPSTKGFPNGHVDSFVEHEGRLLITTYKRQMFEFDGTRFFEMPFPPVLTNGYSAHLAKDEKGRIWARSLKHLSLRQGTNWLVHIGPESPDTQSFIGIGSAIDGGLWIATTNRIGRLENDRLRILWPRDRDSIDYLTLTADSRGDLWTASHSHGAAVYRKDGTRRVFDEENVLPKKSVRIVFEDGERNIWIGTDGGGLVRFKPRLLSPPDVTGNLLTRSIINSFAEGEPGEIWVATHGSGLIRWSGNSATRPVEGSNLRPNSWLHTVRRLSDGSMVAGALEDGLFHITGTRVERFFPSLQPKEDVSSVAEPAPGHLLAGTIHGLFEMKNGRTNELFLPGVSHSIFVRHMATGPDGAVYLGTENEGLWRWKDGAFTEIRLRNGDRVRKVNGVQIDREGSLWATTRSQPVIFAKDGVADAASYSDGFPKVIVYTLLATSDERVWLGTSDGLILSPRRQMIRFVQGKDPELERIQLMPSEGLAHREVRCLLETSSPGGGRRLLAGTIGGVSVLDLDRLLERRAAPRIHIEQVSYQPAGTAVGGQVIDPFAPDQSYNNRVVSDIASDNLQVPAGAGYLDIRFTGISLANSDRTRFRYRLVGLRPDWVEADSRRYALFHDLRPGNYRFEVRASNVDGVDSAQVATLSFQVRPFFWQTLWFRLSVAVLAVGGSGGLVWMRARLRLKRQLALLEAERALAREKTRLASVLESTGDFVAFADADLRLIYLNPAAGKALGLRSAEGELGADFVSLLFPSEKNRFTDEIMPAARAEGRWSGEVRLRTASGKDIPTALTLLVHRHAETKTGIDFYSFIMSDLTERKVAEDKHRLLEAELRQSQKMEAVGLLAGGVAHDFNNLLQVILGYTSLAMDRETMTKDRDGALQEVKKAARKAAQLTSQLLAFGRRQPLQMVNTDINRLIADSLEMIRRLIGSNIEVVLRQSPGACPANVDRGQIEQVLLNLCVNARDAMPSGGRLTVETSVIDLTETGRENDTPIPASGRFVRISVQDTGCGIPDEVLPHIFEPFFTTKPKERGTGLGLSVVYGIIEQHGGSIRVESVTGKGSTFHVHLPFEAEPASEPPVDQEVRLRRFGSGTILLAEDEEAVRNLATKLLTRVGFTVLEAADGEEALRLFAENRGSIDLLLMDVMMPKMGGPEAVHQIHQLRPDVPVIYASGFGGDHLRDAGKLKGQFEILQKPYNQAELIDRVNSAIRSAKLRN